MLILLMLMSRLYWFWLGILIELSPFIYASFLYGLHSVEDRRPLWQALGHQKDMVASLPWIILGDFHSILYAQDRQNGSVVTVAETQDFLQAISDIEVSQVACAGPYYSWSNKSLGSARVWSRIDWAFGNSEWQMVYGDVVVQYLPPSVSDHSPLVFRIGRGNN